MKSKLPDQLSPAFKSRVRRALLTWYRAEARDLPWRRTKDPYAIWLSEILLQQTRVDQGLPYYERFIAAFPTVQSLADAHEDRVLKLWEGLGYYSRARNLHRAARIVAYERKGEFPASAAEWIELPGVGRYTAGAIASVALGESAPILDGNVIRVLARVFNVAESIDISATRERLWSLAAALVPRKEPGDFNQAVMELGARVCAPRTPECGACPIARDCRSRAIGVQEQRPVRKAKPTVPHHEVVVAVISKNGRYLIGKRPPNGLLGGLWEFPGGKVKSGETHQRALQREIRDGLGIRVKTGGLIASVEHAYTHFRVTLNVYKCNILGVTTPKPNTHIELKWVPKSQFRNYPFPKSNHKFLPLL